MKYITFITLTILFFSCVSNTINSEKEYFTWINNKGNHLVINKIIGDISLTAKYLPPELLTYNELKQETFSQKAVDSLLSIYQKNRTFLLTIAPQDNKSTGDIMYYNIANKEEYEERLNDLNFNISQYIQLKTDSNTYVPVLHAFENTYGITSSRSIYLVFSGKGGANDDLLTSGKLELVFNDLIFLTGISYFGFAKNNIDNIPHINFWKR